MNDETAPNETQEILLNHQSRHLLFFLGHPGHEQQKFASYLDISQRARNLEVFKLN